MARSTLDPRLFIVKREPLIFCEMYECPIEVAVTFCQPSLTMCMAVSP